MPRKSQRTLESRWSIAERVPGRILGDWLSSLEPVSIVSLEDKHWIALKIPDQWWMLFVPGPDEIPADLNLSNEIVSFLSPFLGIRTGPPYFPDSGFFTSEDLLRIRPREDTYPWVDGKIEWLDSLAFYHTSVGNVFVIHPQGYIGKWIYDIAGGPLFERRFESLEEFSRELIVDLYRKTNFDESRFL